MNHLKIALAIAGVLFVNQIAQSNPALTPGVWANITPPQVNPQPAGTTCDCDMTYDLQIDPSNPSTLYITINSSQSPHAIWKTTDAGSNWVNIGTFTNGRPAWGQLRVDPHNSNHLYSEWGGSNGFGFCVSTDGGNTWASPAGYTSFCQAQTALGYSFGDLYGFDVDPTDFNHVLITAHANTPVVGETKDGGATWMAHVTPSTASAGLFTVFFLYDPALNIGNSNTWLFETFYDGLYRTSDGGTTWAHVATNTQVAGMSHQRIYYTKATGTLYTGASYYPARSTDNGVTWQTVGNGSKGIPYAYYYGVFGDGNQLYTGPSGVWGYHASPIMVSPESDGVNWTAYNPNNTGAQSLTSGPIDMAFDSVNRIMYSSNLYGILALKLPGPTMVQQQIGKKSNVHGQATKRIMSATGVVVDRIDRNGASASYNIRGIEIAR